MTSRAIRLSRLHALNWYGYQDTLPVEGNLVLAGVTGSGKSILMDLLMLVLVGPERARHHFNRSATGTRSDRTIKGYCLLDTKREDAGQTIYFHDKGVVTYIGAEFTWPDNSRVETWGLRIEFRNTAENDGQITPFFCQGSLDKADFLESDLVGKKRPLELPAFRALLESKAGRTFASSREYLRDMANPAHLNFNRDVLDRLLPSAMSFTNLKSFDEFCRLFVLPGEAVPVDDVVASYRDFEAYEKELRELNAQLERLTRIRELSTKLREAERDRDVSRYLAAEQLHEHHSSLVTSAEKRLAELKAAYAGEEARLKELEALIEDGQAQRERLLALLHESADGRLYHQLTEQIRKLELEIERLRLMTSKVDEGLRRRIKAAREWMAEAKETAKIDTPRLAQAIQTLEDCEIHGISNALSMLSREADGVAQSLRRSFAGDADELRRLRADKLELDQQISALRHGLPPVHQPLFQALKDLQPRALRELCEVNDERWREAVEVAFTEKFAIIVDEMAYPQALRVYETLKASASRANAVVESLIHPQRALNAKTKVAKDSLASKIDTTHPIARAVVDALFGEVVCVDSVADFEKHPCAVLPDGFMQREAIAQRSRHYDGLPFVGKGGLARQLEIKQKHLGEIEANLRRLEPIEQQINRVIAAKDERIPDFTTLAQDLVRAENLPSLEEQHATLMQQLQSMNTDAFGTLEQQAHDWKERTASWEKERFEIAKKGSHREIEQMEKTLATRRGDFDESEEEFTKVKLRIDVSVHLERLKSWREEAKQKFLVPDVMAREFAKASSEAERTAIEAVGDMKAAMIEFKKTFQPKFDDLPDDGRSTAAYEKLLVRIEDANIPDYEKKAQSEKKRWESLFRTQVLSRMQQALKRVEDIIFLLNKQLHRPIGQDRYRIERRANPDFQFYRRLIDMNALHHEDDLFYASIDGDLRTALDNFLTTLVKQANSPEAARLLDYRQYFDYDLLVSNINDPEARPVSVDKKSGVMSGGENQSPYFVAILASYLHAYNRHETRWKEPSLALVPIDEAFSKLSGERIQDCLSAMKELDLQGMFSMSSGNIPYTFSLCDELIVVTKRETRSGNKTGIRNVPSILFRNTPEGEAWMKSNRS